MMNELIQGVPNIALAAGVAVEAGTALWAYGTAKNAERYDRSLTSGNHKLRAAVTWLTVGQGASGLTTLAVAYLANMN